MVLPVITWVYCPNQLVRDIYHKPKIIIYWTKPTSRFISILFLSHLNPHIWKKCPVFFWSNPNIGDQHRSAGPTSAPCHPSWSPWSSPSTWPAVRRASVLRWFSRRSPCWIRYDSPCSSIPMHLGHDQKTPMIWDLWKKNRLISKNNAVYIVIHHHFRIGFYCSKHFSWWV